MKSFWDYYQEFTKLENEILNRFTSDDLDLTDEQVNVIRYALNMARMSLVRAETGRDIDLTEDLRTFRENLASALANGKSILLGRHSRIDSEHIKAKLPYIKQEIRRHRQEVLDKKVDGLSSEVLDEECGRRKLVLALGGDGGSALAHLGTLEALQEQGIVPDLVVATGTAAMVGLLRALSRDFDLPSILEKLPPGITISTILKRYVGRTRYGLMGVFTLDGRNVGEKVIESLTGGKSMTLGELSLPFRIVATGLKNQFRRRVEAAEPKIVAAAPGRKNIWRRAIVSLTTAAAELAEEPHMLIKLAFGGDELTAGMDAVDAVGFSASIPGVIHYDLLDVYTTTTKILDEIFDEHGLYRICDGVVVENVPARTAIEEVQKGAIGTRNAFILACDCFAPRPGKDMLVYPLQMFVRGNAKASMEFADLVLQYSRPPSPFRLVPHLDNLKKARERAKRDFEKISKTLKLGLKPIPSWSILDR